MFEDHSSVEELIQELEELRLQETELIKRIRRAHTRENRDLERIIVGGTRTNSERVVSPVKSNNISNNVNAIYVGRRVEVSNTVKPLRKGQIVTVADRRGTVTRVTDSRVYFTTDSGNATWRAHRNLILL
jgi:seryl-tRNA synthetase